MKRVNNKVKKMTKRNMNMNMNMKDDGLTMGSGASSCLHMIHGTPVFRPTAIFAAHFE
ncbi:hypothetical protein HanRHA438_Chr09g0429001 [Helianthus annuus]|nr:hypothetical protein HanRHA438_Chr09g0429001 [Helianthus annuus]